MAHEVLQEPVADPYLLEIKTDRQAYVAAQGEESGAVYDGTLQYLSDLHEDRAKYAYKFTVQLPEKDRDDTYWRIVGAEQFLISHTRRMADYERGSAQMPDDFRDFTGANGVLLTAEHATDHIRTRDGVAKSLGGDYGTGGLGLILHEDTNSSFLVPTGRQTGDSNDDLDTRFKRELAYKMENELPFAAMSLHGMTRTKVTSLTDTRNHHIILGIGANPSDETMYAVDVMREVADTYDLRLGVNVAHIVMEKEGPARPKRREDGSIKTLPFAAKGAGTSRSFTQNWAEVNNQPLASVQVELSDVLRLLPIDSPQNPSEASATQRMGVYLGKCFLSDSIELLAAER